MLAAGIDIGTTTISMIVLDMNTGEMKWRRTIEHRSFMEGIFPESPVQDPERISRFVSDPIVQMKNECGDISAIGLTGQMHGMLYVNSDGQAVSPLYTWQDGCGNKIIEDGKTAAGFLKEAVGNAAAGYGVTTHFFLQNILSVGFRTFRPPDQERMLLYIGARGSTECRLLYRRPRKRAAFSQKCFSVRVQERYRISQFHNTDRLL